MSPSAIYELVWDAKRLHDEGYRAKFGQTDVFGGVQINKEPQGRKYVSPECAAILKALEDIEYE